jgi:hypothetical protein
MNATLALFIDAYRQLNAKRMFWISLAVSGIIVVAFGGVALTPKGISIFGWQSPLEFGFTMSSPASFYKVMFVTLGIRLWLAWAAMILAIVSTAGLIPDFLASGSVDLYLARPIGRIRLYLVKYTCGLLFVAAQAAVFSVASFVVIGLRGGVWEPGLLLAIPLAVLIFSYLYSVCALVGVLTRSTLAALLVTLIFWLAMSAISTADRALLMAKTGDEIHARQLDRQIATVEDELTAGPATAPADDPSPAPDSMISGWARGLASVLGPAQPTDRSSLQRRLANLQEQRGQITNEYDRPQQLLYLIDTPLPKTSETESLLERHLYSAARLPQVMPDDEGPDPSGFRARRTDRQYAAAIVDHQLRARPAWRIIGTSLAFEAFVVAAGAWVFCRRDY